MIRQRIGRRIGRLSAVHVLLVVAVLEVAINRVALPLLRPARGAPPAWHTVLDYAGLFLFYFVGTLAAFVLVVFALGALASYAIAVREGIAIDDPITNFGDGPVRDSGAGASVSLEDEDFDPSDEARMLSVRVTPPGGDPVRVVSLYAPNGRVVGSLNEAHLFNEFVRDADLKRKPIESIMQPAFPFVDISTPVELLATMITPENPAVLVRDFKTEKTFIITRSDIIRVLA